MPTQRFQGFGLLGSVLVTLALALGAFCVSLFFSIFAVLAFNSLGHPHPPLDYADTYRLIAFPAALAVGLTTAAALAFFAVRRRVRA